MAEERFQVLVLPCGRFVLQAGPPLVGRIAIGRLVESPFVQPKISVDQSIGRLSLVPKRFLQRTNEAGAELAPSQTIYTIPLGLCFCRWSVSGIQGMRQPRV